MSLRTCGHGRLLSEPCEACDKTDKVYDSWLSEMQAFRQLNREISEQNTRLKFLLLRAMMVLQVSKTGVGSDDLIDEIETELKLKGEQNGK